MIQNDHDDDDCYTVVVVTIIIIIIIIIIKNIDIDVENPGGSHYVNIVEIGFNSLFFSFTFYLVYINLYGIC